MKRSMWKVQEQIFQHQLRLLDHELLTGESDDCSREQQRWRCSLTVTQASPLREGSFMICTHEDLTAVKQLSCVDLL